MIDSTVSIKVKQQKDKELGYTPWLATLWGVEGRVGALGLGLARMTSESIIHMDMHKPNNKLVNV